MPNSKNIPTDDIQDPAVRQAFRYLAKILEDMDSQVPNIKRSAWTPRLAFGGSSLGITYTRQTGSYILIDDAWMIATGDLILTSKGAQVGSATIEDLPKPVLDARAAGAIELSAVTYVGTPFLQTVLATSRLSLGYTTEAGVFTVMTDANLANNSFLIFTSVYKVK